ncbi:replication protein [Phage toucan80]|nr:replication protein [Phage toucan80]
MIPQLFTNGRTAEWRSPKGNVRYIYAKLYDKAHEIELHDLPRIARTCGEDSDEYRYLKSVRDYCLDAGVVRYEQELKSDFLRRIDCAFWGLFDPATLKQVHNDFLAIDERLQVTAMTYECVSERLIRLGIVDSTKAANTTSHYAIQWMHGAEFDLSKSAVKTHRARLRKIGIDIARPCDLSRHSPVYIRKAQEIQVTSLPVPDWYQLPARHQLKVA